jgi:hypothetical protein
MSWPELEKQSAIFLVKYYRPNKNNSFCGKTIFSGKVLWSMELPP